MDKLGQRIIKRFNSLKSEHSKWTAVWSDCARYCLPIASPITTLAHKSRGSVKKNPIDITGVLCRAKLDSFLFSATIYQGEQWFEIKARQKGKGRTSIIDTSLEKCLQDASRVVLDAITNSNCIPTYQRFLRYYCTFGTGAFYTEFDDNDELICRQWSVPEGIYIAENSKGIPDTVYRAFAYTARQAVQEFGEENVSEDIRKASADEKEQDKVFNFIHAVYPRRKRDKRKKNPENKPIASIYVELNSHKVVMESGYDTMPYQTPRFYNNEEIYGRCPPMDAIPALKSINIAIESYLKNVEGMTKPLIFAPSDLYDRMSLELGSINPWDSARGEIKIWSPSGDVRSPLEFANQKKEEVSAIFYNDVFQYLEDRKNMTATEAQLRYEEMIQGISPVLANLHNEFFSPLIKRVATELFARGKINIPPQFRSKNGDMPDFEIVYNTRLDTKLKGVLNANVINFVRMVGELGVALGMPQLPSIYIDVDKVVKGFAKNCNVTNDALRSDKDIKQRIEALNQQQQQQTILDKVKDIDVQKTPEQGSAQDIMLNGGRYGKP